jgi:RNA polymerase sigma-70 factor (ECF subfamily)
MQREATQRLRRVTTAGSAPELDSIAERFSQLYEDHFAFVWRSARYLGEPEASLDDAVQDVFLVAYRRFQDFEARSTPRTWLFAITMRVVSDHRRSRRRKVRLLDLVKRVLPSAIATPYEQVVHAAEGRVLLDALQALSEEQRTTYIMADLADMSAPEIATSLDVNLNTVYSRLRAARRELSRLMERTREEGADE